MISKKYIILLSLIVVAEIALALWLSVWREVFWDAVAVRDLHTFFVQLGVFSIIVGGLVLVSGISNYILALTTIDYRKKLTAIATAVTIDVENKAQRIQEDCKDYPFFVVNLVFGAVKSIGYCVVFLIALVSITHWSMIIPILIYVLVGTYITKRFANPLTSLNYSSQRAEANYRQSLSSVDFEQAIRLSLGIAINQKKLNYIQTLYNQIGVIVPILLVCPSYFAGAITMGALFRITGTMGTLIDNLSYGASSYGMYNRMLSCRRRLKEMGVI